VTTTVPSPLKTRNDKERRLSGGIIFLHYRGLVSEAGISNNPQIRITSETKRFITLYI
jgi:hypothetical protein